MCYYNNLEKGVRQSYLFLRENNHTIPSETLDFILHTCIDKIEENRRKKTEKLIKQGEDEDS